MTIAKLAAIASFALAVGAALPAAAVAPPNGADDATGRSTIGVDISAVGSNPANVEQFLASLAPEQRAGVEGGCRTALTYPASVSGAVYTFCQSAVQF